MKQIINRWIVEEKIGIGYFSYRESARGISESLSGVGYNFSLGAEYLLSKHVGVYFSAGRIQDAIGQVRTALKLNFWQSYPSSYSLPKMMKFR